MTASDRLPKERQPDAIPDSPVPAPSLRLYAWLVLAGFAMIYVGFRLQGDWGSLFLNLSTELLGAVIILMLVERRFRAAELHSMRAVPSQARVLAALWTSPRRRQLRAFTRALLARLEPLLRDKIRVPELTDLGKKAVPGFVLSGEPGSGKTTLLQLVAADLARAHLSNPSESRAAILFVSRNWRDEQLLEDAIFEQMRLFTPLTRRSLRAILAQGEAVLMFDGVDEIWERRTPSFESALAELRRTYPKLGCILSVDSTHPPPVADLEVVNVRDFDALELAEIARRRARISQEQLLLGRER